MQVKCVTEQVACPHVTDYRKTCHNNLIGQLDLGRPLIF